MATPTAAIVAGRTQTEGQVRLTRWRIGLVVPAVATLLAILYFPLAHLLVRSMIDASGRLTVVNYQNLATDPNLLGAFRTSVWFAILTVILALALGYPLAYLLASLPPRVGALLFAIVLVPFWTGLMVDIFSFWILLGKQGPVSALAQTLHLTQQRTTLLFTGFSVLVGFVYVDLPLMIFPLYATMRRIDRSLIRAAATMGASPLRAFWDVFVPLSLPGIVTGSTLVFMTTIGYFIVPTLLGGKSENMVGQYIINAVEVRSDLPAAGAMTMGLVLLTTCILLLVNRVVGIEQFWSRSKDT